MWNRRLAPWTAVGLLLFLLLAGCSQEMRADARIKPMEASLLFPDGQSARPLPANVVPRDGYDLSDPLYTGLENGQPIATMPVPLTAELLQQGQRQYIIYCSPCHGLDGYGDGMIVQRGFPSPPSYHSDRLRRAPDGHYFDVISNGFGLMFEYGSRVPPADRWAIIAYIRALQLSQNAAADQLAPQDLEQLHGSE